ncbi:hypothetical protein BD324DRAFT_631029 [Kockovaella imperatae]|uniref:Uncharacterized protein n=1 Tax=Kockovaella imperatae TaxID=4999 RepID=A0A1Y1UC81_9TREE|nr:hypothetical protein BD324DRAFT_631029 [Kockovaella imperatae]ORX35658.1 hypothetical protein BD324DRAFT_631029 [Kockovaella imperatae]
MPLSHRSSTLFRRSYSTFGESDTETTPVVAEAPSSPSQVDPFGSNPVLPLQPQTQTVANPTRKRRTGVSKKQTLLESESTPRIILASPSTSTIHYLFPSSETSSHLGTRVTTQTSTSTESDVTIARKRLNRVSATSYQYNYEPVYEGDKSQAKSAPSAKSPAGPRHAPKDSLDYTKTLKSRGGVGKRFTLDKVNTVKDLGKGFPATVLGPAKRVPSIGNEPLRLPIVTRRNVSLPAKGNSEVTSGPGCETPAGRFKTVGSMKSLRRQQSLADARQGTTRLPALMERENVEGKYALHHDESMGSQNRRKRSQSLSSHRSPYCTSPTSPIIPAPDFGDPIQFNIPSSPSFSHLDYSTAGSIPPAQSSSASSRRSSLAPTKRAQTAHLTSVPMTRGDSGISVAASETKKLIHADMERRLSMAEAERTRTMEKLTAEIPAESSARGRDLRRRLSLSLRRSQSLKRSDSSPKANRTRSQSLSSKSVRQMGISSPSPLPEASTVPDRRSTDMIQGMFLGELNVDLGGRFLLEASLLVGTSSSDSPQGSIYPDTTTPSSGFTSLPVSADPSVSPSESPHPIIRRDSTKSEKYRGRPLHPAFASSTSLLAPSTIGLGLSPVTTPISLPQSLLEEAVDLTGQDKERWGNASKRVSGSMDNVSIQLGAKPPAPAEFFLPQHPQSLRMTRSLGPGVLRAQYLGQEAPPRPARSPSRGPPTPKEGGVDDTTPKWQRQAAGFSLCSPPGAIEPLARPVTQGSRDQSTRRLSRTNKSMSFLSASASFRSMFKRHREEPNATSPVADEVTFRGQVISPPLEQSPEGQDAHRDQKRRERILSEALSHSIKTKRLVSPSASAINGSSRMSIPTALLDSAPISNNAGRPLGELGGDTSVNSIYSTYESPRQPIIARVATPVESPPPEISKWSPSPMKPKRKILRSMVGTPELPSLSAPLHHARSMISLHRAKDSITMKSSPAGPDQIVTGSLEVSYASPRRTVAARQDRTIFADESDPKNENEARSLRSPKVSTSPALSYTERPPLPPLPLDADSRPKWWSRSAILPRTRRLFSPDPSSMETRSTPGSGSRKATMYGAPVSSADPPIRKVLEELIQREEEEREKAAVAAMSVVLPEEPSEEAEGQGEGSERYTLGGAMTESAATARRQSRSLSRSSSKIEKAKKVMDWREAVDGTRDLREMEQRWKDHVQQERDRLKRIGQRTRVV